MQENDKKIIIRVMNIIALLGNIGTLFLINALNFLAKNVEEFSEISRNFENAKVSMGFSPEISKKPYFITYCLSIRCLVHRYSC